MIPAVRSMALASTLAILSVGPANRVAAQTAAPSETERSAVAGSGWVPVQSVTSRLLRRAIDLDLDDVSVQEAITEIAKLGGLPIGYDGSVIASKARVSLRGAGLTVNEALATVLRGTELEAYVSMASGQVVVRAAPEPDPKTAAPAQTGTIVGRVTDGATGAPVAGADVRVVGTQLGATANDSGRYVLPNVPAGEQSVRVQRIGYETQTQTVTVPEGGTLTLDFTLGAMATRLNELVVTVTGEQRVREVGNVVARIQADSLANLVPVMSFGDLIQGRAPGVLSMTTSNNAGQAGTIRLRGLNSFGVSNDPIVVLDGIRVEATAGTTISSPTSAITSGGLPPGGFTGRLADLDPDEIASVEVVKGPSAATLYGTDAANGVLVITTKRGRPGPAQYTAITEQAILEQRLDDWSAVYGGAPYYAFGHSTLSGVPQRCTLLERAAGNCALDSLVSFNAFEHPETRPFKNGYRQQYALQVSGGTAGGTTYFLSGDYEHETGTFNMPPADQAFLLAQRGVRELPDWQIRPNAYKRINLRANLIAPLGAGGSMTLTTAFVSNRARQSSFSVPFHQVGYRDGNGGWYNSGFCCNHRPAYMFAVRGEDMVRRFIGSLAANHQVRDWLTLRGTVGADLSTNAFGMLARRDESPFDFPTGMRTANELTVTRYSLDLAATATRVLSDGITSKTSLGVQYNFRTHRGSSIEATDLPLGGETIAGAADLTGVFSGPPSEATLTTAVAGGYVEEVLGIRDRIFVTGALRFDGASAFGRDFSVAVYPKAHLSWVVTDGQQGPRLPGVSALRLRAAYGASGVQPGPTDALQQIQVITGVRGATAVPAAVPGAFGNPDLEPERTGELEAGFDLELAAGRVRLEFAGYRRTSHDALVNRPLAPHVGGGSRWENIGSVRNRGLELLLAADVLQGRALSAGITLTGLVNENKLLELGEGVVVSAASQQGERQDAGYPLYGQWGKTIASFADANGNGIIEPNELVLTDNTVSQYIGPGFPTREATVAPYLGLFGESIRLNGLFQYRGGFYLPNFPSANSCQAFIGSCRAVNDISAPLADQARAVALNVFGANGGYVEPASYLLLRELVASLTVPPRWGKVVGARNVRLVLAARNVALLWRQGTAPAPENNLTSQDRFAQVAPGPGPSTYWLLRLNLNF